MLAKTIHLFQVRLKPFLKTNFNHIELLKTAQIFKVFLYLLRYIHVYSTSRWYLFRMSVVHRH
jgi:hypothetical protein